MTAPAGFPYSIERIGFEVFILDRPLDDSPQVLKPAWLQFYPPQDGVSDARASRAELRVPHWPTLARRSCSAVGNLYGYAGRFLWVGQVGRDQTGDVIPAPLSGQHKAGPVSASTCPRDLAPTASRCEARGRIVRSALRA